MGGKTYTILTYSGLVPTSLKYVILHRSVKMSIFTKNERAFAWNVIGVIPGAVEPGKYPEEN